MKKIFSYFFLIFLIFLVSYFWEKISIPFDQSIIIKGEDYLPQLHNPLNDSIRFVMFIFVPLFGYIIYNLIVNQSKFADFFKSFLIVEKYNNNTDGNEDLSKISFIFLILIFIEFLSLDLKSFISEIDMFHEGLWLTASSNKIYNNEFWKSSYIGRGLFGNFYNYFVWKIFNINTIGISRYLPLVITLLNKVILIFIAKSLIQKTSSEKDIKNIFLIILGFLVIDLFDYDITAGSYFRLMGLLILALLMLNYFDNFKIISFSLICIGLLSSISFFWFIDIGFFVNFVIIFLFLFLFLNKLYKNITLLIISIFFGWIVFYIILGKAEFDEFVINTTNIIQTIEYIQGLIYPTPFFSKDTRSTKALLIILLTGLLIINILLSKNEESNFNLKISLVFLFIISCVSFKIALSRSDTVHIKAGILLSYIPFYFLLIKYLLEDYNVLNYLKNINISKSLFSILIFIIFTISIFFKNENIKIKNISNFYSSSKIIINENDFSFVNNDYKDFIIYYKKLIENENCVLIFTNENALPYFLKKPTCSKFYTAYTSSPEHLQKRFVEEIRYKKPNYLVYDSLYDYYDKPNVTLNIVNNFILDNYTLFKKINKWTIYKIN